VPVMVCGWKSHLAESNGSLPLSSWLIPMIPALVSLHCIIYYLPLCADLYLFSDRHCVHCIDLLMIKIQKKSRAKQESLPSQRWPHDAIHPNFVHAYGDYILRGFWFWTNLSSGNFVYFSKSDVSAVQGHPRSLIFVPIESAYATSY